jgi:hypothetical protein
MQGTCTILNCGKCSERQEACRSVGEGVMCTFIMILVCIHADQQSRSETCCKESHTSAKMQ